jgi:hypothetical protein
MHYVTVNWKMGRLYPVYTFPYIRTLYMKMIKPLSVHAYYAHRIVDINTYQFLNNISLLCTLR